jgi:hypothetical protein
LLSKGAGEACGRVRKEHRAHVAKEEDVHVEVDAAMEMEHDETHGIGDLDWSEPIGDVKGEPVFVVCVLDYFFRNVGFIGGFRGTRAEIEAALLVDGFFGKGYAAW